MTADTLDRARAVLAVAQGRCDPPEAPKCRCSGFALQYEGECTCAAAGPQRAIKLAETLCGAGVPKLADVAAAAVALVDAMRVPGVPWYEEEGWCVACERVLHRESHADDCPALALDAAIRRLAGDA